MSPSRIRKSRPFVVAAALTLVAGGCLGEALEDAESASGAESADPTQGRRAARLLLDGQRTVEARDLDGDGVSEPPQYDVIWEGGADEVAEHERLYGSIRKVSVTVDVDYPRADAVGIWLGVEGHEVQLRAPEYYTAAQSRFRHTFTTEELGGVRAYGRVSLRIAGTELAIARDCYSDVQSASASASASNRGVFRSSSWSASESRTWSTRRCQEFFRPLSVREVKITVDYDVPPMAMPSFDWTLGLHTAYTNDTKWFEVEVPSSVPPPYVMSGIDVSALIWHPASMGGLQVALVRKDPHGNSYRDRRVVLDPSSVVPAAEGADYVRIEARVHDFDEARLDGTWRLELVEQGPAAPGTTYELKSASVVFNTPARGPIVWRSTPVTGVESPHPFYVRTSQSWDLVAPEGAIACRLAFDRVDFARSGAELQVLAPSGTALGSVRTPSSGSNVLTPAYPGGAFRLTFTTEDVWQPGWGFRMSHLVCKY